MAFVYEAMDETRKQELLALAKPPTVLSFHHGYVIDRERDIIFLNLGGQGERPKEDAAPPYFYCLVWKGLPIHFSAYITGKQTLVTYTYFYEIPSIICPKQLEAQLVQIKESMRAACECFEQNGRVTKPIVAPLIFNSIHFI